MPESADACRKTVLFNVKIYSLVLIVLSSTQPALHAEWLTYGHDPARTGWAFEESRITPDTVAQFSLRWTAKLDNKPYSLSALTAPVVAGNVSTAHGSRSVVYVAGISGTVFALDAETGQELWNQTIKSVVTPLKVGYQRTFLCPDGITATPVIDKSRNLLYVLGADGALRGLDLGSGLRRYGPVQWVAPFAKSSSLNLVGNRVYTTLAQGCGNGTSGFYSLDISDAHRPDIQQLLLSNSDTAGIWGRGGAIIGDNGRVYGSTADGRFDSTAGDYSNAIVSASANRLDAIDYFLPANWLSLFKRDLDLGSASPVYFGWHNRKLVASATKEAVVYLLDADQVGHADHQTALYVSPLLGNEKGDCCTGFGVWGGLSTARDADGNTWLFVPLGGPPSSRAPRFPYSYGSVTHGVVLAFKVVPGSNPDTPVLEPAWMSEDVNIPDPVVVANGVVFVLGTGENARQKDTEAGRLLHTSQAVLHAFDMKTGKQLFGSGTDIKSWVHFSGLAISDGCVFVVDHDSNVYCFGLPPKSKQSK